MSKIKCVYENGIDKVWYDSTNVIYSECDDVLNSLKTLKLTFKDGRTYVYKEVDVNDYLLFRESQSQGKAFFRYIKKYECERVDNSDLNKIKIELEKILDNENIDNKVILFNKLENISNEIIYLTNEFKKINLTENELSYISYFINKMIKNLALVNFTDNEINLLEVTDKVKTILDEITSNSIDLMDDNKITKILKTKLL